IGFTGPEYETLQKLLHSSGTISVCADLIASKDMSQSAAKLFSVHPIDGGAGKLFLGQKLDLGF
ncbi:MAG: hypothetical protein KGJ13_12720, partial [Patescibacteria group bacterium]|nr:hypothetical protein [Patescibacteria group bacterium]